MSRNKKKEKIKAPQKYTAKWVEDSVIPAIVVIALIGSMLLTVYAITRENNESNLNTQVEVNQNPTETSAQLQVETLKEGKGDAVKDGDTVKVNYKGTLTNGTQFDSSYDRNTPFEFTVGAGEVISGWELGLIGMKVGEKRKLTIPSALGYGSNAVGSIPANSTLIFEIELLAITQKKE